jgi:hypothetical protein
VPLQGENSASVPELTHAGLAGDARG